MEIERKISITSLFDLVGATAMELAIAPRGLGVRESSWKLSYEFPSLGSLALRWNSPLQGSQQE